MNYCKLQGDGTYTKYTIRDLKSDYPNVSFPRAYFNGDVTPDLSRYDIYQYTISDDPTFDPATEKVVDGAILMQQGSLVQQRIVVPLTAEELALIAEETKRQSVKGDAVLQAFLEAGPEGIETYIDNNVTNMAGAVSVLKKLAKILWLQSGGTL